MTGYSRIRNMYGIPLIPLLLIVVACVGLSSGARYSGARSSRYSSYRSYRSYRSSSYYGSGYRSYTPTVRYSRGYYGYRSYYYYYYNMYYYYPSSSYYHMNRGDTGAGATICENYEANQNGTTLGSFACPMPFEPSDFTYCCGENYVEYCCKLSNKPGMIAGIVIGALIGVAVVVCVIICIVKACKKPQKRVAPESNHDHSVRSRYDNRNRTVSSTRTSGLPPIRNTPSGLPPPPYPMDTYRDNRSGPPMAYSNAPPAPPPYAPEYTPSGTNTYPNPPPSYNEHNLPYPAMAHADGMPSGRRYGLL